MDVDPRRLTVLAAVARTGGVLAAAQALHVTPSAVSQTLAKLEREAELALLVRGGRRLGLTETGLALAERGERIAAELAGARHDLAAVTQRVTGTVTLVAFPTAVAALVGPTAALVRAEHPAVELRIVEAAEEPATERLRSGTVDILVIERDGTDRRPAPRGLRDVPLLDDPYLLAVPQDWPVPRTADERAAVAWISGPAGSATRSVLERLARSGGWRPRIRHEALEFPAVLALVAAGLGCALVPRLAWPAPGTEVAAAVSPVAAPSLGSRRLLARHRTGRREPSPAVRTVVVLLQRASADATARP